MLQNTGAARVHRVRRRPRRSQHARCGDERHRSIRARRGRRQRPLHVQRTGRLHVGAGRRDERVARASRPRSSCGSSRTSRRRPTCCCSGEVDIATIAGADRQRVESEGYFVTEQRSIAGEFFFNQMEGLPTADVAVRQALMGALDLQELMSVQTAGNGVLATGLGRSPAEGLPRRHRRGDPHGRRGRRSGRTAARRGRVGDGRSTACARRTVRR